MQRRRLEDAKKKITGFVLAALLAVAAVTSLSELRTVSAATAVRDLAAAMPESVGVSAQRLRRIDDAMKKEVDAKRTAGVVTLLTRHGKVVQHNAVGVKDVRKSDPVQKDSIFRIYSMSKPITGAAMMMLFEEGKWRLDDPVSRHIPEFAKLQVLTGTNPDGSPTTEPARRQMTMRGLMTHTAGLGYVLNSSNPVDRMIIQGRVLDTAAPLQTMIDKLAKMPLLTQPGTRWQYSIAVDVQGYLVEKLSGLPFADFLKTRLFDPLGMKDTAYFVPAEKRNRLLPVFGITDITDLAPLKQRPQELTPSAVEEMYPSNMPGTFRRGGHGLFSTTDDYAKFARMLVLRSSSFA
jgi:CubicO group peptidase (beta-lactamase class C family)